MNNLIFEGESLADLQRDGLWLIQKEKTFKFGTDAVLLSDFAKEVSGKRIVDLCTGTGIIPILLSSKTNAEELIGVEIQEEIADMANRSIIYNNLQEKIKIICKDLITAELGKHSFNTVTCNPPYMKCGDAVTNELDTKTISRHEVFCTIEDVVKKSAELLRDKGHLVMVHRPSRLADVIYAMKKYNIEPKRLQMVHSAIGKPPVLFLIDGAYKGGSELKVLPPLIMYDENGNETEEFKRIYGKEGNNE